MKKLNNKKISLISIVFSLVAILFISSVPAFAQMQFKPQVAIPGEIGSGTEVDGFLLWDYVKGIYDYSFGVAGILAAIVLMGGGVLWLISGGNQSKVTQAKSVIGGSIIGLVILFSAYIILNTINPALLEKREISLDMVERVESDKNKTNCCVCKINVRNITGWVGLSPDQYNSCNANTGLTEEECVQSCEEWGKQVERSHFLTDTNVAEYIYEVNHTCGTDDEAYQCIPVKERIDGYSSALFTSINQWTFQTGIKEQVGDMSPDLVQFLNCMRSELPDGVGQISSISDSNVSGDLSVCNQPNCSRPNPCQHSCESCHYGGSLDTNKSYAVDLGDENNYFLHYKAAMACDPRAYVLDEGNHTHISVSACPRN